jgi:hypothetical protein
MRLWQYSDVSRNSKAFLRHCLRFHEIVTMRQSEALKKIENGIAAVVGPSRS